MTIKKTYFSTAEAAKILGMSRVAVFKKIKKGEIHAEKIGRSYAIPQDEFIRDISKKGLSENKQREIEAAIRKAVKDYGEALRLLGKE